MAFAAAVIGCQVPEMTEPQYVPGEADDAFCYGVSFPKQDAAGSHSFDPEAEKVITLTAKRTNTFGDITVPVEVVDTAGVFTVAPIVFADGQEETTFTVSFPTAKEGVKYGATIDITDTEYASIYGAGAKSISFDVLVVTWQYILNPVTKEPAVIPFVQNFWGEICDAKVKFYEVGGVRTCFTESLKHDYNGEISYDPGFWSGGADYEWTFTWYPNEKHPSIPGASLIDFPFQPTGYVHSSLGMIYVGDAINTNNAFGQSLVWLDAAKSGDYPVSYYDGNGGIYLYVDNKPLYR